MKIVYIEVDRCIACLNCQRICTFHQAEAFQIWKSNIVVHVDMDHRRIATVTCRQCRVPRCMEVCPSGALSRNPETQAVVVDKQLCVGCGLCVTACPFGSIQVDGLHQVAVKCDLCGGKPLCVQVCMAGALHFGSLEELGRVQRKHKDQNLAVRAIPCDKGSPDAG